MKRLNCFVSPYLALSMGLSFLAAACGASPGDGEGNPDTADGDSKDSSADFDDPMGSSSGGDESSDSVDGEIDGIDVALKEDDSQTEDESEATSSEPEVCDGKDNDGDGKIDNVDAGGDGICDCLNIGTIGRIGPWSNGGDIFKDWLDERSPMPAYEIADQELSEGLLAGLDVIVVLRADTSPLYQDDSPAHHQFSDAESAVLDSWVRSGGGLMTTIGYQADEAAEVQNVNRLLAPLGMGYDYTKTDLDQGFLSWWNPDHPISDGVENINIENGVQPMSAVGTVVARGEGDKTGVVAAEVDSGRVIVFGDEWVTYDSEWADTESQQVELLWLNMIKWMSPPESCQVDIPPELIVR